MWRLFWIFSQIGLLMFGGGSTAYALIEKKVLKHKLLSKQDLLEIFSMSYLIPGPNSVILASFVGKFYQGGFLGSFIAVLGILTAPILLLFFLFSNISLTPENLTLLKALEGMRIALMVIIFHFLLRCMQHFVHWIQFVCFALASFCLIFIHPHPAIVILGAAFLGSFTYRCTKREKLPEKSEDISR